MSLRFPCPRQRAAVETATRQEGVRLQEYVLSAAHARATAVEERFLHAFRAPMSRSGDAFAAEAGSGDPGAEQCAGQREALRDLERQERGHAV
ncbi:hypothetical protein [Streptomyces hirsutus]|uniref:hypothetical protein n=1 Tax=Streptomyces hirsutus TaxID=35620 RepID=UPI0036612B17